MSAGSLAPISQLRMGNGGAGRGLGSLAPLGSLPSMSLGNGISSNSLSGGLIKPKLGGLKTSANNPSQPLARSSATTSSSTSASSSTSSSPHHSSPTSPRVQPLKFAVRYNPPTIALEYRDTSKPAKNRMKVFELTKIFSVSELQIDTSSITSRTPIERLSTRLSSKFPEYLSADLVTQQQLQRIVKKSLSRPNNTAKHGAIDSYSHSTTGTISSSSSSSSSSSTSSFSSRSRLPSSTSSSNSHASTIHSSTSSASSSYIDEEFEHSRGSDSYDSKSPAKKIPTTSSVTHDFFFPGEEEEATAEDLNRATDEELKAKKAQMNVAFEKNVVKPTDANYVYDKQVEFEEPTEESGWD